MSGPTTTKKCSRCQEEKPLADFYYHRVRKRHMASCKACNKRQSTAYQQKSDYRERPEYVLYQRAYQLNRTAKNKSIPAESVAELRKLLLERWEDQGGICFYTGKSMSFTGYPDPDAMTVDRLVPALGYIRGNVVLCRSIANRAKQDMEYTDWLAFCRAVLAHENTTQALIEKLHVEPDAPASSS